MRPSRLLALVLLVAACNKPAEPAQHSDTPGTADAPPPEPQDEVEPVCAVLLPTLGKWESEVKRQQEIAALISQGHVGACDHRGPGDTQPARGSDEASYCRAAIGHRICKNDEHALRSIELRTRAFPESADAWLALAAWQIAPLKPADTGLPYNEAIPPAERLRLADEVLGALANAERLRPDDPRVYDLIAVAHEQRLFARMIVEHPTTPAEKLEVVRAREDGQKRAAARAKLCKLQRLPSCRPDAPAREVTMEEARDMDVEEDIVEEEVPLEEIR